ncbi:MAG TPA: hypothetical protein VIG34_02190 [Xanthobacteraceae bacterium]
MSRMTMWLAAAAALSLGAIAALQAQQAPMTFFITSVNPGKGADFGGLAGADAYCQQLAQAAGAGNRTWRAYLSATGTPPVHARDRIGRGPWSNAKGVQIAASVEDLHKNPNINKETALDEKGQVVKGGGDTPNWHDILTGTQPDGTAFTVAEDRTCGNWTKGGEGTAIVGHHDRRGIGESPEARSWNSSHPTRGCSLALLQTTGSGGLLYCFATN